MLVEMKSQDTNIKSLTIGTLARRTSVGVPALRFYERAGLTIAAVWNLVISRRARSCCSAADAHSVA